MSENSCRRGGAGVGPDAAFIGQLRALRELMLGALRRSGVPRDQSEDVAQQALCELSRRCAQLQVLPPEELAAYARSVLRTSLFKAYRTRRRREEREDQWSQKELLGNAPGEDLIVLRDAIARRLARLERLPRELSRMILACEIEGLTIAEVAVEQGIPLGTAKSRLRRAKAAWNREEWTP